jgi:hypothetical protein
MASFLWPEQAGRWLYAEAHVKTERGRIMRGGGFLLTE